MPRILTMHVVLPRCWRRRTPARVAAAAGGVGLGSERRLPSARAPGGTRQAAPRKNQRGATYSCGPDDAFNDRTRVIHVRLSSVTHRHQPLRQKARNCAPLSICAGICLLIVSAPSLEIRSGVPYHQAFTGGRAMRVLAGGSAPMWARGLTRIARPPVRAMAAWDARGTSTEKERSSAPMGGDRKSVV